MGDQMFYMNGILWKIQPIKSNSPLLIDRTGRLTLATTDPNTKRIYLSKDLSGELRNRVLVHELGHAALFSFGLLDEIHRMTYPEYWIEIEEFICNMIADYGWQIFTIASQYLGDRAVYVVPAQIERMIA